MQLKLMIPVLLMICGITWLASTNLSKANYFVTVDKLDSLGDKVYHSGLKVKGRIVVGTIDDKQKPVTFTIHENGKQLNVAYVGEEPLPDMFKDRAEAVVEGSLRTDGVFEAAHVQAKCASKYEAEAPEVGGGDQFDYPAGEQYPEPKPSDSGKETI